MSKQRRGKSRLLPPPATSITDLNVDTLAQCASSISLQDLSNFAVTCKYLRKMAYSDTIWQRLFRERWPQKTLPSAISVTSGFREAYLSRRMDGLQFKFSDPFALHMNTNSNPFDQVLLNEKDLIFSQGSMIRMIRTDGWLSGTPVTLRLRGHSKRITCMRLFPRNETSFYLGEAYEEEKVLVTSSGDSSIRLWRKGFCWLEFRGHSSQVTTLSDKLLGNGSGKVLASGGEDGTVRLWSLSSSRKHGKHSLGTFFGHKNPIQLMSVSMDNPSHLVTISRDSKVMVWDAEAALLASSSFAGGTTSVLGYPIGIKCHEHLAYVAAGSSVVAIDLRTMQKVVIAAADAILYSFQAMPSKSLFCVGSNGRAMLYDTRRNSGTLNSEPIAVDGGHGGPVTYLHMDPYKIVTGSPVDEHFNVLDANTGAPTNSLTCGIENGTNNSTRCCALAVNGSRIVTGSVNDVAEVGCLLFRDFANASCPVFFF
ncbi:hypothetical protein D8674_036226 [Pyrus ussuriensis x Pyrus communis]|uniref:Uncharacterized protein n=1 Tax=Pyrus ussuriensis x Pyrus communis TaxID=2448454 RepID=A0A5N5GKW1_9ROSA|nr:hypothetical protein D8674_036226 [Pyrus ussuriensis x Pyrus communis]